MGDISVWGTFWLGDISVGDIIGGTLCPVTIKKTTLSILKGITNSRTSSYTFPKKSAAILMSNQTIVVFSEIRLEILEKIEPFYGKGIVHCNLALAV